MKLKPIGYHPAARLEAAEALEWYEWNEPGLGARFLADLDKTERFISRHPGLGALHFSAARKRKLHVFPYHIIYAEEHEIVWCSRWPIARASRDIGMRA